MGNINLNRTQNDPDKPLPLEGERFQISNSLVWLVAVLGAILTVFWLLFIGLATIACSEVYGFCFAYAFAYWSGPVMVWLLFIFGLMAAWQYIVNMAWIDNFGVKLNRKDTRESGVARGYDTMLQRAKSESTRGLDTYSPSYSNMPEKEPSLIISDQDPLIGASISLADMFNRKDP